VITPAGATLIAALYPIVVLLLAIDVRRPPRPAQLSQRIWFIANASVSALGAMLGIPAVLLCVKAVNEGVALQGFDFRLVQTAGSALTIGVVASVAYWAADRIIEPWQKK
jgi:hypothetical protein